MDDEDKLHARHLRDGEKHRNESPEQRAIRLQVQKPLAWPASPLNFISLDTHSTKPMCICTLVVQSQLLIYKVCYCPGMQYVIVVFYLHNFSVRREKIVMNSKADIGTSDFCQQIFNTAVS